MIAPVAQASASSRSNKLHRLGNIGNAEDAALFGRFDDVGLQLVEIGDLALHMLGHHRLHRAGAHLHGLLHQIIEPPDLQRRKEVVQVGWRRLRPRLLDRLISTMLLAGREGEVGLPFAVAAVEDEQSRHRPPSAARWRDS